MDAKPSHDPSYYEPPTPENVREQVGRPAPRGMARFWRRGLVALVLLLVVAFVLVRGRSSGPEMRFLTAPVSRGDLAATVTATGSLRGKDTVIVGAETSGQVKAVHVDFNDRVHVGQLLAEIDPSTIQAALVQAEAQLAAARASVKNAEATATEARLAAERSQALAAEGLISKQALEAAVAAAERAVAAVLSARAQVVVAQGVVESNRTTLGKTEVRSPIDGIVLSRTVEPGQTVVAAMSTPELFTVARDLREMEVEIAIDEADVGRTKVGQTARFTVDAWPGRSFTGTLRAIHNVAVVKDNVVTYQARLGVENDELLLRPGMTATVTIETDKRTGVIAVPNAALRFSPPKPPKSGGFSPPHGRAPGTRNEGPRVWVLGEDGKPSPIPVEVGLTDGVSTEVKAEGLQEGGAVIVDAEQAGPR